MEKLFLSKPIKKHLGKDRLSLSASVLYTRFARLTEDLSNLLKDNFIELWLKIIDLFLS